ncbi:MAG: glycosyltransferase family 4 protein [Patescibacteria group bacterium]
MTQVLFLTRLYSPYIGGVETHVLNVTKELQQKGYQVSILTEQFESDLLEHEQLNGIDIIRIPENAILSKVTLWKWIWSHRELFIKADIVHVHDVFWWVVPVLPLMKSKYFVTFHGWEGQFPIKKTAILQRQAAAKLAKGVIQVGEYIEKWYKTKPDIVTYGGSDSVQPGSNLAQNILKKVFSAAKQGRFISQEKQTYEAVFVGRLSEDNDISTVCEFFSLLKNEHPNAHFLFIGDGPLAELCKSIGTVTGFVPDVDKYLVESKMVCANSYLSILNAQSLGKLVCSFYSNQLKKDYLTEYPQAKNMIIVGTAKEGVQKLTNMKKNPPLLKAKIKQASEWAKLQTWQKVSQHYEYLWKKVRV